MERNTETYDENSKMSLPLYLFSGRFRKHFYDDLMENDDGNDDSNDHDTIQVKFHVLWCHLTSAQMDVPSKVDLHSM